MSAKDIKSLCFLGYDETETKLIGFLRNLGHEVHVHTKTVTDLSKYDLSISFGYRHILSRDTIANAPRPVINLHISFLPFNRGAHPNFWSWIEGTPAGVTIHEINEGIDTGSILFQERLQQQPAGMTFRQTYGLLFQAIEDLFITNSDDILSGEYVASVQAAVGTSHRASDLPLWVNWDDQIEDAIQRYRQETDK